MEMLVEKTRGGGNVIKNAPAVLCKDVCEQFSNCDTCPIQRVIDKLAKYEQQESKGLLLHIPCKEGETLYIVNKVFEKVYPVIAKNDVKIIQGVFHILCESERFADYICYDDIGKTAFLSKEEADAALASYREMSRGKTEDYLP